MAISTITREELMDLRLKLFKVLIQYVQTRPVGQRQLSLTEMALITGKTKISVKSALESLQQNGFITIDRGRITLNKTSV